MKPLFCLYAAGACLVLGACASDEIRNDRCTQYSFASCLAVTPVQCDAMYDQAKVECDARIAANTMLANMPDSIKANYVDRCILETMVKASGLPEDKTKSCIHW